MSTQQRRYQVVRPFPGKLTLERSDSGPQSLSVTTRGQADKNEQAGRNQSFAAQAETRRGKANVDLGVPQAGAH